MRMALRRHFDHTAPRISELDRVIMCGQSHTLCVLVWYDTCDRCFTLMMWTFRARRPFPRKRPWAHSDQRKHNEPKQLDPIHHDVFAQTTLSLGNDLLYTRRLLPPPGVCDLLIEELPEALNQGSGAGGGAGGGAAPSLFPSFPRLWSLFSSFPILWLLFPSFPGSWSLFLTLR